MKSYILRCGVQIKQIKKITKPFLTSSLNQERKDALFFHQPVSETVELVKKEIKSIVRKLQSQKDYSIQKTLIDLLKLDLSVYPEDKLAITLIHYQLCKSGDCLAAPFPLSLNSVVESSVEKPPANEF